METEDGGLSLELVRCAVRARRRVFGALLLGSATVLGAAASAVPPSYRASVVLTIEPGKYPNDFLRPNVIPGLDTRLGGVEKLLESAPTIEALRARAGLAASDEAGGVLARLGVAGDPIEEFRKAFRFEVLRGVVPGSRRSEEALLVEISFKHSDPGVAARVVNACAERANEENDRFRRAFVDEVVRFVEKAEERARAEARRREDEHAAYKLAHLDRLPEQEPYVSANLGQLRIRYSDLKNAERFAQARVEQLTSERGLLVAQITLAVQIAENAPGAPGDPDSPGLLRRERARVEAEAEAAGEELRRLQEYFTDKEPRVRIQKDRLDRLRQRLVDLDGRLARLAGPAPAAPPPTGPLASAGPLASVAPRLDGAERATTPAKVVDVLSGERVDERTLRRTLDEPTYRLVVSNPGYGRIRTIDVSLRETREALLDLVRQREDVFAGIRNAEATLAAIPEVRQRLDVLGRALLEAREDFRRVADQLENARKALAVENEGKGEQLRVIDLARPPTKPGGPGRPALVALALALALAVSVATCVALEGVVSPGPPARPAGEEG